MASSVTTTSRVTTTAAVAPTSSLIVIPTTVVPTTTSIQPVQPGTTTAPAVTTPPIFQSTTTPIVIPSSSSLVTSIASNTTSLAPVTNTTSIISTTSSNTSSIRSSTSTTTTSSSASAVIVNTGSSSSSSSNTTMSGATIGAIAGSVAGALLLVGLAWTCWRRLKGRRNRVPPPPPRPDMSYTSGIGRSRTMTGMGGMVGPGTMHRESSVKSITRGNSYNNLLYNGSPQISRHPSYYANYPVATSSTADDSPPNISPNILPSEPTLYAAATPRAASPVATQSRSLGLGHPNEEGSIEQPAPARASRRIPSVDRLRMEAGYSSSNTPDRVPSPSSGHFPNPHHPAHQPLPEEGPYVLHADNNGVPPSPPRSDSPHHSIPYMPTSPTSPSGFGAGYPAYPAFQRASSSASLSGRSYFHIGPAGGAPHQGRPIQLEMPRPLGLSGSSPGSPDPQFDAAALMRGGGGSGRDSPYGAAAYAAGYGSSGSPGAEAHGRRVVSGEYAPAPGHRRIPSSNSISGSAPPRSSTPRSPQARHSGSNSTAVLQQQGILRTGSNSSGSTGATGLGGSSLGSSTLRDSVTQHEGGERREDA